MSSDFRPPSEPIGLEILPKEVYPEQLPERERRPSRFQNIIQRFKRNIYIRICGGILSVIIVIIIAVAIGVKISQRQSKASPQPKESVPPSTVTVTSHSSTTSPKATSSFSFSLCPGDEVTKSGTTGWICSTAMPKPTAGCPPGSPCFDDKASPRLPITQSLQEHSVKTDRERRFITRIS